MTSSESGYRWVVNSLGIVFEVDRLRRERHELIGEMGVKCDIPGARTVNGYLLIGDLNFSSVRARSDRAKMLQERSRSNGEIDWIGLLEDFTQQVTTAERQGDPACDIWSLPPTVKVDDFSVDGIALPRKHPAILFGDGGSAKSMIALYIAGKLALQGVRVALFDWELEGEEHRERFEKLFRDVKPPLTYCRCEAPLTNEIDRLRRVIREEHIAYAFFDSISFACDGRPEDAEIAARYLRACRSLGIGSLHIAHVNKSEDHENKPFGSSWWYNGARSIWFIKANDNGSDVLNLGFFHRKSNLGPLRHPVSLKLTFLPNQTIVERASMSDTPELAAKMKIWQRMAALLSRGAMTMADIAGELDEKVDSIRKTVKRSPQFVLIKGGSESQDKVGLRDRTG